VAGARLAIKVSPKAVHDAIKGWHGEALKVAVTAAPDKGKANQAVLELLAEALQVAVSRLSIVRGETSPHKLVEVAGIDPAELLRRLNAVQGSARSD
jgi:uncharacterized protein (TIGR00251 family)